MAKHHSNSLPATGRITSARNPRPLYTRVPVNVSLTARQETVPIKAAPMASRSQFNNGIIEVQADPSSIVPALKII